MKITKATTLLRTELFKTRERTETTDVVISYTDTVPDPRIDAAFMDWFDARRYYFGVAFHYIVKTDGTVEIARNPRTISSRISRQDQNHSIAVGVVGGRAEDGHRVTTINSAQRDGVEELLQSLANALGVPLGVIDYIEQKQLRDQAIMAEQADEKLEMHLDLTEAQ